MMRLKQIHKYEFKGNQFGSTEKKMINANLN
jgi:hypothetical protein